MIPKRTENIAGFPITAENKSTCIRQLITWIDTKERARYFVCANPHCIEVAIADRVYRQAMQNADIILPDGVGMVIASFILRGKIRKRITGSDIFIELSRQLNNKNGYRYFFLGSTEQKLQLICEKVKADFPNITISGSYAPPFKTEFSRDENRVMIEKINQANPDVLWIGMTAPKQEKWIYQNKNELHTACIAPVGAVFDFYIGAIKRSHPFFFKLGMEWLPRLIREPRRLWRRMFVSAPKFMIRLIKQRVKGASSVK